MFDDDDELERKKPDDLPIFKKGQEIYDVVRVISDLIPEENERLQQIKMQMLSDAAMLTVKVAGAEGGDLYDIRMESAALIRKAAHDLMIQNHSLKAYGFEHVEYFIIVRNLIEEYRLIIMQSRREILKNIATIPLLGAQGWRAFRVKDKYGVDVWLGATIQVNAGSLSDEACFAQGKHHWPSNESFGAWR